MKFVQKRSVCRDAFPHLIPVKSLGVQCIVCLALKYVFKEEDPWQLGLV